MLNLKKRGVNDKNVKRLYRWKTKLTKGKTNIVSPLVHTKIIKLKRSFLL